MSTGLGKVDVMADEVLVPQAIFVDIKSNWHLRSCRRVK